MNVSAPLHVYHTTLESLLIRHSNNGELFTL